MYGGEDVKRRPLSDVWALDLSVMAWCKVDVVGGPKVPAPPARSGHVATVYKEKYLVVFGGKSTGEFLWFGFPLAVTVSNARAPHKTSGGLQDVNMQ